MPDDTVYDSEQELRTQLRDLDDLMKEYDKTQQSLVDQRYLLIDQMQMATASYEQQRDDLDRQQKELTTSRQEALQNREALLSQLDKKLGKSPTGQAGRGASPDEQQVDQTDGLDPAAGPTTRDQVDRLKEQLSRPELSLDLDPPGMASGQAGQIDADLKLMAQIKAKQQRLDGASQNLRDSWSQSKGPKR